MRDVVTTALDVLGLLLLAAGVGVTTEDLIGHGTGYTAAGAVVLGASWWWARPPRRKAGGG